MDSLIGSLGSCCKAGKAGERWGKATSQLTIGLALDWGCRVVRLESIIHNNSRLNTEERRFLSFRSSLIVLDFKFYVALQCCLNDPTYALTPNFTHYPNTSICVADIIQHLHDPTKPLSSVPESELEKITRHFDYDNELSSQNILSLRSSVWANFLEKASAKIGGGTSDELLTKYKTIQRRETIYFTKQPIDKEAAQHLDEKRVKGQTLNILGEKKAVEKHQNGQDIIFAYQLHIITHSRKGQTLAHKDVNINVLRAPGAFLNTDEKGSEEDLVDVGVATESNFRNFDKELKVEALNAKDG
ncbi:hypothetical protein ACHAQJ_003495 [Trichoderma viride]